MLPHRRRAADCERYHEAAATASARFHARFYSCSAPDRRNCSYGQTQAAALVPKYVSFVCVSHMLGFKPHCTRAQTQCKSFYPPRPSNYIPPSHSRAQAANVMALALGVTPTGDARHNASAALLAALRGAGGAFLGGSPLGPRIVYWGHETFLNPLPPSETECGG